MASDTPHEDTPDLPAQDDLHDISEDTHEDPRDTPEEPAEDVHEDDEHSGSLAGKALTGLVLLLAGAGFALWAGPKIAPNLPAGMAPVAEWLSPGGAKSAEELAALKAETEARFAALPAPLTREDVAGMISSAVADATQDVTTRLDTLADQVQAADGADLESRLAALETKVDGLQGALDSLMQQLSEITAAGGEISADTSAQIATYGAQLDGLKAEIARLSAQNGALSQKIDDIAAAAERRLSVAAEQADAAEQAAEAERKAAAIRSDLAAIKVALNTGRPYAQTLDDLRGEGVEVPQDLAAGADGVATLAELRADFPAAANAAIQADVAAGGGGDIFSSFGTFLKSQVATRSLEPQEGDSVDAIQSRAEAALKQDDLDAALAELATLPDAARAAMADWIDRAEKRQKAETAFAALAGALQSE